jgi:hypothetical protein
MQEVDGWATALYPATTTSRLAIKTPYRHMTNRDRHRNMSHDFTDPNSPMLILPGGGQSLFC